MTGKTTAEDVAAWMLKELRRENILHQEEAVDEIEERFGEEFTYENANGNPTICKPVLDAFRKLTGDEVVWSRSDRYWRPREKGDLPDRQQP